VIEYRNSLEDITAEKLCGFFCDWPNPPSKEVHLQILKNSFAFVIAYDNAEERVVGFVNAISDGLISAYIPLLEVLPEFKGQGIGRELIKRIETRLADTYAIDIVCDSAVTPFYTKLGYIELKGMAKRNYDALKKKV
jgi:ribosomal protein S18 acetylase RimI-like enzyme